MPASHAVNSSWRSSAPFGSRIVEDGRRPQVQIANHFAPHHADSPVGGDNGRYPGAIASRTQKSNGHRSAYHYLRIHHRVIRNHIWRDDVAELD